MSNSRIFERLFHAAMAGICFVSASLVPIGCQEVHHLTGGRYGDAAVAAPFTVLFAVLVWWGVCHKSDEAKLKSDEAELK